MSLASCMRANSAGDLMLRQPATTGMPEVVMRGATAWAMRSAKTYCTRSSRARGRDEDVAAFSELARSA
jgi:hypothetical protein